MRSQAELPVAQTNELTLTQGGESRLLKRMIEGKWQASRAQVSGLPHWCPRRRWVSDLGKQAQGHLGATDIAFWSLAQGKSRSRILGLDLPSTRNSVGPGARHAGRHVAA